MRLFSIVACIFLMTRLSAFGQMSAYTIMKVIQYPTCTNSDGIIAFTDSAGEQISDALLLFSVPDNIFIGSGSSFSGLKQGRYKARRIFPNSYEVEEYFFLSIFKPLDHYKLVNAFINSVLPDTCSLSKGGVRLAKSGSQQERDTLNMVQWNWSTGQTGLNVSGLKAGLTYWVRGSIAGCPYYIPHDYLISDSLIEQYGSNYYFRNLRINKDTLFFSIVSNRTLDVGFTNVVKALCSTPTGKLTAQLSNTGTPPYAWKWNNGSLTATIENVRSNTYSVIVTDAVGCVGYKSYFLPFQNPAGYQAQLNITSNDSCLYGVGQIVAQVQGGLRPYKYKWDYNAPFTTDSIGTGLISGPKYIQVVDSNGCILNKYINLGNQNPMSATTTLQQPDCFGQLGKITVEGIGGVLPYHAAWDGYPNENSLVFDSLTPGNYTGYLVDANGCRTRFSTSLYIPNSCYRNVTLDFFRDDNSDCINQSPELPIFGSQIRYKLLGTNHYQSSFGSSNSFDVLPGAQDIYLFEVPHFTPACISPDWNIQDIFVGINQNFFQKSIGLGVSISRTNYLPEMYLRWDQAFRPGFDTKFFLEVRNDGNQILNNGAVTLKLPVDVSLTGSSFPFTEIAPDKYRFQIGSLNLRGQLSIPITLKLASTVPLGVSIPFEVDLDTASGETILSDNRSTFSFISVGSYDPNDITVYPSPVIRPNETKLDYRIRFQNLGTYYAENVVVVDTLPDNVDISTFRAGFSKHTPSSIEIKGRVLTIRYKNIWLHPAIWDEDRSHGVFNFTIHRLPNLAIGTKVLNSASIYFDFNAPVKTNVSEVEVNEVISSVREQFILYPNPGEDIVTLIGSKPTDVEIFDNTGKWLSNKFLSTSGRFSIGDLPDGLYLVRFKVGAKIHTTKLMVQRK